MGSSLSPGKNNVDSIKEEAIERRSVREVTIGIRVAQRKHGDKKN